MSPRFIRFRKASSVRKSTALERFLEAYQNDWLREKVESAFIDLKENYESGNKVPKGYWPPKYTKQMGLRSLYVVKLGPDWRLLYTLLAESSGTAVVCLEMLTHKQYDKLFGYHTT